MYVHSYVHRKKLGIRLIRFRQILLRPSHQHPIQWVSGRDVTGDNKESRYGSVRVRILNYYICIFQHHIEI